MEPCDSSYNILSPHLIVCLMTYVTGLPLSSVLLTCPSLLLTPSLSSSYSLQWGSQILLHIFTTQEVRLCYPHFWPQAMETLISSRVTQSQTVVLSFTTYRNLWVSWKRMKKSALLDPSGCWLPWQGHTEVPTLGLEKLHKQAGFGERGWTEIPV